MKFVIWTEGRNKFIVEAYTSCQAVRFIEGLHFPVAMFAPATAENVLGEKYAAVLKANALTLPKSVIDWLEADEDRSVKITACGRTRSVRLSFLQEEPVGGLDQTRGVEMNISREALEMTAHLLFHERMEREMDRLKSKAEIMVASTMQDFRNVKIGGVAVTALEIPLVFGLRVPDEGGYAMEFEPVPVKHPISNRGWKRVR